MPYLHVIDLNWCTIRQVFGKITQSVEQMYHIMILTDFHDSWPSRLQKNPVLMGQLMSADSKDSSIIHRLADTRVDRRDFALEIIFKEM